MFGPEGMIYSSIKDLGMVEEYQEDIDKDFVKLFKKFDKYSDVSRIGELIELLKSLRHNEHYIGLIRIFKKGCLTKDGLDSAKIPFFYAAQKGFGFPLPFFSPPLTPVLNLYNFVGLESIIELSHAYSADHNITSEDTRKIMLGNIMAHLTYFIEDYDKHNELPEPNIEFFKKLKKVKIKKRAWKMNHLIYVEYGADSYSEIQFMHGVNPPGEFNRTYYNSAFYLAGCNAVKDSRDLITCEDLVIGYLLTFKVLLSDVRPLVDEYYSEDKWLEYNKKIKGN